jgi:hypothetical protein
MDNKNIALLNKNVVQEEITINRQVLLIGENLESEEVRVLKQIGLSDSITKIEEVIHEKNSLKQIKQIFNRNVYKGSMIKSLCNKYDLSLIRVDKYAGEIPLEIGKAIIQFRDEHTIEQVKNENRTVKKSSIDLVTSRFFILVTSKTNSKMKSYTLFYRENDNGNYGEASKSDTFIEVYSGGEPFSKLREVYPLFYKESFLFLFFALLITNILTIFSVNTFIISVLFSVALLFTIFSTNDEFLKKWNNG